MNVALWVLQGLLAAAFLAHGWLFLSPPANMVEQMNSIDLAGLSHLPWRGRSAGRNWAHSARHHAHPAPVGALGRSGVDDRDGRRHLPSPGAL